MIKMLNGIHETVAYDTLSWLKLYHNHEAENYPVHWHTALEIIIPIRGEYAVSIDRTPPTTLFTKGTSGSPLPERFMN